MATSKKTTAAAPHAAPKAEKPAAEPKPEKGKVRIFPTHRRQAGPLVVAVPVDPTHSDELVIDDSGLEVDEALAEQLIAAREATTEAPAPAEE